MQITTPITNLILAMKFKDYITTKYSLEIILQQDSNNYNFAIDSSNLQLLDDIKLELAEYLKDPNANKYIQASWQNQELSHNKTLSITQNYTWNLNIFRKYLATPITTIVFLISTILFLLSNINPTIEYAIYDLTHHPDFIHSNAQNFQLWRYFSSVFVHLSFFHYLSNLIWWLAFAPLIEKHFGSLKIILLFFISGILSSSTQYIVNDSVFYFGLSGVVYSVLAYTYVISKHNKIIVLSKNFAIMLIIGILIGFAGPLFDLNIGNTAHITGFLIGILLALYDARKLKYSEKQ